MIISEIIYTIDDMASGVEPTTEQKWNRIKTYRNELLSDSDWTQLEDSSADKVKWAEYRQKLRDIPQDYQVPEEVIFPEI